MDNPSNPPPQSLQTVAAVLMPPPSIISSLGKRKRDQDSATDLSVSSGISIGFSKQLKEKVESLYDGCWHCAAPKTHVGHVIGHRERILFSALQAKNRLGMSNVDHRENAMPLCPLCHDAFDETSALGWVFIPTDLKFFLDFERKDFERRTEVMKTTGSRPGRICPSPLQYRLHQEQELEGSACGGLYRSYVLRHYLYRIVGYPEVKPGVSPFINNPKPWHGDPMASLEKAFKAVGQQPNVFPREVKTMLRELLDSYCENDELSDQGPQSKTAPRVTASRSSYQSSNDSFVEDNGDAAASLSPRHSLSNRAQNHSAQSMSGPIGRSGRPPNENEYQKRGNLKRKREPEDLEEAVWDQSLCEKEAVKVERVGKRQESDGTWKWGPGATSQMAMKFYTAIQHIPRQGKAGRANEKESEGAVDLRVQPNVLASPPPEPLEIVGLD